MEVNVNTSVLQKPVCLKCRVNKTSDIALLYCDACAGKIMLSTNPDDSKIKAIIQKQLAEFERG
ncbi:MAG: hypothetical protein ACM3O3_12545 [Syntrophothermus sp.]